MGARRRIVNIIMREEENLSMEDFVGIKEFIDSIIVMRTKYLTKGCLERGNRQKIDMKAGEDGASPTGPEP